MELFIILSIGKYIRIALAVISSDGSIGNIKRKLQTTCAKSMISLHIAAVFVCPYTQVNKGAKIRNRYNQVPHLTQKTNGKVTKSQLDTTNESQEVSSFPEGDHKAQINRHAQKHNKHKTETT